MDRLAKDGYLEKIKLSAVNADKTVYEWRWGNREAEFSEASAATFIETM
jgi:hypothetical protein